MAEALLKPYWVSWVCVEGVQVPPQRCKPPGGVKKNAARLPERDSFCFQHSKIFRGRRDISGQTRYILSKNQFWSVSFITKVINETLQNQILVPIWLLLVAFGSDRAHFGSIFGLGSILSKKRSWNICVGSFLDQFSLIFHWFSLIFHWFFVDFSLIFMDFSLIFY